MSLDIPFYMTSPVSALHFCKRRANPAGRYGPPPFISAWLEVVEGSPRLRPASEDHSSSLRRGCLGDELDERFVVSQGLPAPI